MVARAADSSCTAPGASSSNPAIPSGVREKTAPSDPWRSISRSASSPARSGSAWTSKSLSVSRDGASLLR